ncbi:MAG: histidine kinase [Ideonella sp.]|nr:histidine kinase [Ideonella sp.]MCC7457198.1 histidine kinase [Nitrospira sp.]
MAPDPLPAATGRSHAAWLLAWLAFWLLMVTVAVHDHLQQHSGELWKPLLWEGSSCLVASVMLGVMWRRVPRYDATLARPLRWFALQLRWLPLLAPLFVASIYAIRHAVFAVLGQDYVHPGWGQVFAYECAKFTLFYLLFVAAVFGLRTHAALGEQRLRAQAAQLAQLTQQLQPHFLFNALNTVAATIHTDPEAADTMLTRLAALLRAATDLTRRPTCTLDEELRLAEGYTAIMCERFADRVTLVREIDAAARACRVPTLSVQPLLENAFRHGVERFSAPTRVLLRARCSGRRLRVEVEQDRGELPATPTLGVGLGTLRERLAALHGAHSAVGLEPLAGGGARAWFELPAQA